jgi:hypothetical protein
MRWSMEVKLDALDELEEAAKICEAMVLRPAGYHGQWEGYGPFDGYKTGPECAIAIRAKIEVLRAAHIAT